VPVRELTGTGGPTQGGPGGPDQGPQPGGHDHGPPTGGHDQGPRTAGQVGPGGPPQLGRAAAPAACDQAWRGSMTEARYTSRSSPTTQLGDAELQPRTSTTGGFGFFGIWVPCKDRPLVQRDTVNYRE